MENVITSGPRNEDATKHVYLAKWKGHLREENTSEMFENVKKMRERCWRNIMQRMPIWKRIRDLERKS